jgi:hypothetical protein
MDMPALTEKPEAATVARPLSTEPSLLKMAALDAGVPLREVQVAARHADPRTTTVYDRRRQDFDKHAAYVVVAFVAGG